MPATIPLRVGERVSRRSSRKAEAIQVWKVLALVCHHSVERGHVSDLNNGVLKMVQASQRFGAPSNGLCPKGASLNRPPIAPITCKGELCK